MKKYLYILFIVFMSCSGGKENNPQSPKHEKQDTLKDTKVKDETKNLRDSVSSYLADPLDFYLLKKSTYAMHSGGNIRLNDSNFYSVNDKNYIYYNYWAIEFVDFTEDEDKPLSFKVLKPWGTSEERYYQTDNEILVGIKSCISWDGLQNSNFVNLADTIILKRFGKPDLEQNDCLIYSENNRILSLKIQNNHVLWFKYFWLNKTIGSEKDIMPEITNW